MSDHEDGPYVIIERRSGSFGTFVWGLLLGAAAALLYAPKSGRETRDELRESMYRMRDEAEGRVREVQRTVTTAVEDARRQVEEGLDAARSAARTSREDVEERVRRSGAAFRAGYDAARSAQPTGEVDTELDGDDGSRG